MKNNNIKKVFDILEATYQGNWQYRGSNTPFLERVIKEGKRESILGHVWAVTEIWFLLRRVLPALDKAVDAVEVYEIILNHDLGETYLGDIPIYEKLHGRSDDKDLEKDAIKDILKELPKVQTEVSDWFEIFESDIKSITKLEPLIAKWLDNIQGNHFSLVFGNDLAKYSKPIDKILQIKFVAYTNRLLELLKERGLVEAAEEVKAVALQHTKEIKAKDIEFDDSNLNINSTHNSRKHLH